MIGRMVRMVMSMDRMICMVRIRILYMMVMWYGYTDNNNTGDIMIYIDVINDWDIVNIDVIVRSVSATWYRTNVRPLYFCQYTPTNGSITSHIVDISIRISCNCTIMHTINIIIRWIVSRETFLFLIMKIILRVPK